MTEPSRWATATGPAPDDPGHLLPDDAWQAVVDGAAARLEQLADPRPAVGYAAIDRTIAARSHGGIMAGGPRLGVIHSAETPLAPGYAYSIAANWFATKATTSATVMIDPTETIRLLPDNVVAYHVGPNGNGFTVGVEQAGYARLTRAEWLTPAGLAQMRRVADYMRECRDRWGMPLRWASPAEIRAAKAGGAPVGWCTHDDVRAVLGGTTHTDPRPNYPQDELMRLAATGEDADVAFEAVHAMTLAETRWFVEQMKPVLDGLHVTIADEDAQTDRLEWALTDPQQGVRAQIAGVVGQLSGLGEAIAQLGAGGGGVIDLAAVQAASAAGVREVFAKLTEAPARPATARRGRTQLTEALDRLAAGPQPGELDRFLEPIPAVAE
jgi:hypothetical protein